MFERKKTGSIVCPNCGKLISANSKQCYNCGRKNPGLWGFGPAIQKLFGQGGMVPIIIGATTVIYIISLLIDISAVFQMRGIFDILAPSGEALYELGMTGRYAMAEGRWWTLITANYLHGGLLHILFNMLWLRNLGLPVENFYGSARAFLIFTFSGIVGFFLSDVFGILFTVGASASIFGLLGALVYYGRKRGGSFGQSIYRQVGTWAIVLFLFGFMMPGVNNVAHAGGFIGGYIASMVLGFQEMKRESQNMKLAALATVVLTIVSFVLAVLN